MRVIFTQNVKKQGQKDEVKDINEGFARNFLIPQKLAVEATPATLADLKKRKDSAANKNAKHSKEFQDTLNKLKDFTLTLKKRANEDGHLFSGITTKEILLALKEKQIYLKEKDLDLMSPIKKTGESSVSIKNTDQTLKILIEKE